MYLSFRTPLAGVRNPVDGMSTKDFSSSLNTGIRLNDRVPDVLNIK